MKTLFAGLGNPTPEYEKTRHNLGFWVIDLMSKELKIALKKTPDALVGKDKEKEIFLVKPLTFMNHSGRAILPLYEKTKPDLLVLIYDDMDVSVGKIKIKEKGGSGGHKGVQSVISCLGNNFARIRVGIGRPEDEETAEDFVLSEPCQKEKKLLIIACEKAKDAAMTIIEDGLHQAMNRYN
ncbi:MAG: aminoacyl-tRNA hydrolase [bacterium]|nr:aminoacyl-tRNA hydrolase [bacterium]